MVSQARILSMWDISEDEDDDAAAAEQAPGEVLAPIVAPAEIPEDLTSFLRANLGTEAHQLVMKACCSNLCHGQTLHESWQLLFDRSLGESPRPLLPITHEALEMHVATHAHKDHVMLLAATNVDG